MNEGSIRICHVRSRYSSTDYLRKYCFLPQVRPARRRSRPSRCAPSTCSSSRRPSSLPTPSLRRLRLGLCPLSPLLPLPLPLLLPLAVPPALPPGRPPPCCCPSCRRPPPPAPRAASSSPSNFLLASALHFRLGPPQPRPPSPPPAGAPRGSIWTTLTTALPARRGDLSS